ncbi:MAG: glycosyltransferase family 4 protein [Cyanobacteria bacterium SZAS-4]|nr:glycosyltransferase family 4 protein [Cyanobacteria bacterium SZAS-4]
MSIINEITKVHVTRGGHTQVIVSKGTRHDYPEGECIEVVTRHLLNRNEKITDVLSGFLGRSRQLETLLYEPASNAVDANFDGTLFLWNAPGCAPAMRRNHAKAQICLYAQNWLFKTYSPWELAGIVDSVDNIVCCSEFIANQTQKLLGKRSKKISGIVNGVDTEKFRPRSTPIDEEVPTILFVGRVQPFKGPDLIIRAAQKIASAKRKFKVRIVGSSGFSALDRLSDYELELRKLAEPISQVVEFQTFVDRSTILTEYNSASISCVPSTWNEPCSLTVPESMACGLPTIASNRGGIPEVGGDGAMFFDPKNINQLAEQLEMLIDNPQARREWGVRARNRAEQITWTHQYDKLRESLGQ